MNFKNRATIYEDIKRSLTIVKGDSVLNCGSSLKQEFAFIGAYKENFHARYIQPRENRQQNVGEAIGEYKHGWSKRGHKGTGENHQTGSSMNQSRIKKKTNPTGQDGQILKCKSCGSFRHLLAACPHIWEYMAWNNADVKPLNQDDAEKTEEIGHSQT